MRLAILGGAGFRTPLMVEAVATGVGGVPVREVVLQDIDAERLAAMRPIVEECCAGLPNAPRLRWETSLDAAVEGADFVFSALRVGGAEGRVLDERVALGLGVLGQETVGPGGLAFALRTIPVMLEVARAVRRLAPSAWLVNFTNPVGIVTEAMQSVLGDRVLGVCDTPIGLVRRACHALGVSAEEATIDYAGLNHLGWLRGLSVGGRDRLPSLLADDEALGSVEEARLLGLDAVRGMGALPNEYLHYYLHPGGVGEAVRGGARTRGEVLVEHQRQFLAGLARARSPLDHWRRCLREREVTYMAEARGTERDEVDVLGGGYQEIALQAMSALAGGPARELVLDVRNRAQGGAALPGLPEDMVVEIPCIVDADGVHPRPLPALRDDQRDLLRRLRDSERAIAHAAVTGDAASAEEGFVIHPLVDDRDLGRRLLAGYRAAHPALDRLLRA